ncbi:MAG: SCP2 sterol-binding domain-containing protein [Defluviitaleaceae bacterium]|nr:SCP2 sterol-binding domain-containing protein [Defluviitaleaceae bacterium]
MKIISLNSSLPNYDNNLAQALQVIHETLSELGVEVVQINLALMSTSYYDGERSAALDNIVKSIDSANAIILGSSISNIGKGAAFEMFAEHLEHAAYKNCLSGKNCMLVLTHRGGGVRASLEGYSRALNFVGANDSVKIALRRDQLGRPPEGDVRAYLERQTEDFYRIAKANRKFYLPDESLGELREDSALSSGAQLRLLPEPEAGKRPENELLRKLGIDSIREEQERDINEITQFFAGKLSAQGQPSELSSTRKPSVLPRVMTEELDDDATAPPRLPTCRQLTQSLTHHFQPQMAAGVAETIQFNISGDEAFSGFITINNSECEFAEGESDSPDITILADSDIWKQVVKGKVTAQKAFMVGQLKVRGNFVLLSKFEQLFNTSSLR